MGGRIGFIEEGMTVIAPIRRLGNSAYLLMPVSARIYLGLSKAELGEVRMDITRLSDGTPALVIHKHGNLSP